MACGCKLDSLDNFVCGNIVDSSPRLIWMKRKEQIWNLHEVHNSTLSGKVIDSDKYTHIGVPHG